MTDVIIHLASFNKDVQVSVPDAGDLSENFNEAAAFVKGLEARAKIRDQELGVDPRGATHEIVRKDGVYRLERFRFG
ncbi:MAG TPA: hypothetical protein VEF76_03815 [Patescibacteria group bacterium]|nr:hypothetical protein [Patescibacteria group bacterium]